MKIVKKLTIAILLIAIIIGASVPAFAKPATKLTDYPFVLVHGMLGYGENEEGAHAQPYWGMSDGQNIPDYLRSKGYTVAVPSVGPLSSAWDRACELYAQLTGTVVDYGEAHSKKFGHNRYGRDYTGRAVIDGGWDLNDKINLFGHSFGGPTINILASLLAYGDQDEISASGENCSELFKGGHADSIYSVITLSSPMQGTPVSNLLYDTKAPIYAIAAYINYSGMSVGGEIDFMMDQWGLTCDPTTGKTASLNPIGIYKVASSADNAAYDMTIQGAREFAKYRPVESAYYYSFSADMTKVENGAVLPDKNYGGSFLDYSAGLISMLSNKHFGGVFIDKSWAPNDGLVPVVSAVYPCGVESCAYTNETIVKPGVWYYMPTVKGNHGYYVVSNRITDGTYDELIRMLNSTLHDD